MRSVALSSIVKIARGVLASKRCTVRESMTNETEREHDLCRASDHETEYTMHNTEASAPLVLHLFVHTMDITFPSQKINHMNSHIE